MGHFFHRRALGWICNTVVRMFGVSHLLLMPRFFKHFEICLQPKGLWVSRPLCVFRYSQTINPKLYIFSYIFW